MASINQNSASTSLPNFCNLGTTLRSLVLVNGAGLLLALARVHDLQSLWPEFLSIAAFLEPALLVTMLALCGGRRMLERMSYRGGMAMLLGIVLIVVTLIHKAGETILAADLGYSFMHVWLLAAVTTGILLFYFDLRARALSPALAEARLQALQARIRPHFLFNSLNAVLSLIRSEPRRAERALENMADLFRVLMADNRRLITLQQEVDLCRQYLEIEQLRLGDRLQVAWHTDKMPGDALIPPLVLQPLLENAVYHGVEPASLSGEIVINIYRNRNQVVVVLRNPYNPEASRHSGNKMALDNIRERLALHFDAEASMKSQIMGDSYQVTITMPYVAQGA